MVTSPQVGVGRGNKLKIFAQNIRGLGYKIDELLLHCINGKLQFGSLLCQKGS